MNISSSSPNQGCYLDEDFMATKQAVTQEQVEVVFDKGQFIKECGTKSAAIRKLSADGKTRGEIAKMLDIKYQHVRNVLITPVKNPKTK
jgi:hypothetical protein